MILHGRNCHWCIRRKMAKNSDDDDDVDGDDRLRCEFPSLS
jgi:hypothetical protein